MGLFDLSDVLHLTGYLVDKSPNVFDAIDLADDIKLLAEKNSFYKNARNQYQETFSAIEKEYNVIKEFVEVNIDSADQSLSILNGLTAKKNELEISIFDKVNALASQHNISTDDIWLSLKSGAVLIGSDTRPVLSKLFQSIQDSKQNDARQQGYTKAKKEFEDAVKKLICDLAQRKAKEKDELQGTLDKIITSFIAVSEEYMKITELEIISKNSFHKS